MKLALSSIAAVAAVLVAAAPAVATTKLVVVSNSTIVVPPSAFFFPGTATVGTDTAVYFGFTLGSTLTLSASSFTNSPAGSFVFSNLTIYQNSLSTTAPTTPSAVYGANGTPVFTTPAYVAGQNVSTVLGAGTYTIALSGTANGNGSVGSSITFSQAPEPATWALMVLGFGAVGGALRTSRRKVVFA